MLMLRILAKRQAGLSKTLRCHLFRLFHQVQIRLGSPNVEKTVSRA
jgi:hypothetical protein